MYHQTESPENCGNCRHYSIDGVFASKEYINTPCAVDMWKPAKDIGVKHSHGIRFICEKYLPDA